MPEGSLPLMPASDGCAIGDGEQSVVSTHGMVPFPAHHILENQDMYRFTEKPRGCVMIQNNRKGLSKEAKNEQKLREGQLPADPNFGRPCHACGLRFGAFKCKNCYLKRFCSYECKAKLEISHAPLCKAVSVLKNQAVGIRVLKSFFAFFTGLCLQWYELCNTARCCYTSPDRFQHLTRKQLRKKLTRSQEVLFIRLGYSNRRSRDGAKDFVFSTYDVHWDWAFRDGRRLLSLFIEFLGPEGFAV